MHLEYLNYFKMKLMILIIYYNRVHLYLFLTVYNAYDPPLSFDNLSSHVDERPKNGVTKTSLAKDKKPDDAVVHIDIPKTPENEKPKQSEPTVRFSQECNTTSEIPLRSAGVDAKTDSRLIF